MTPSHKHRIAAGFGSRATTYAKQATVHREILQELVDYVRTTPLSAGPWLDLGCGPGLLGGVLADAGLSPRIVGVDFAFDSLREARRVSPGLMPLLADIERLPVRDATFGTVVISSVLQWVDGPAALLKSINRVLVPGGTLLLSAFTHESFAEIREMQARFGIDVGAKYFEEPVVTGLLMAAGFSMQCSLEFGERRYFRTARRALGHFAGLGSTATRGSPATPTDITRLCREYDRAFRDDKGVPVTYRSLLMHAVAR